MIYSKKDIKEIVTGEVNKQLDYIYKVLQNSQDRLNLMREEIICINSKLDLKWEKSFKGKNVNTEII